MSSVALVRRRGWLRVFVFVGLASCAGFVAFLPFAGRFLVREDPLAPADAILVLAGTRVERWLEAVDLYRERWAPLIIVSPGRFEVGDARLQAMGIHYPLEGELARNAMLQIGVPPEAVFLLPGGVDNTAHEAAVLHRTYADKPLRRVIVVTSKYHTRRAGFAFRREFADSPVQIIIRASRYDESDPARWWRRRADVRYVPSELQKLAAYTFGLGE